MYTHNLDPVLLDLGFIANSMVFFILYIWNNHWLVVREKNHKTPFKK